MAESSLMLAVDKLFAGYGKSQILNGISLDVPAGKLVALLGGNGTGKSTTLKAIVGLVRPSSGEIHFDGKRIDGMRPDRMIGIGLCMVPQGKEVFAAMSVEENLVMGAFYRRGDRIGIAEDLERCYTQFPRLRERHRAPGGALSGGERQMLALGRALMARPRFLMLDEPSAALAPKTIADIAEAIRRLKDSGLTILLVEQNVSIALELAEYLYIVRDGRIAFERSVDSGLDFEELRSFYLGGGKHG